MATLSKHGTEIGRLVYVDYVKSYRSDGTVMKNHGFGWKMAGKVKPGADIVDVYQKAVEHQRDFLAKYPAHAAYRKMLHSLAGVGKAWKLHACVQLMHDDVDGVWSECCDGYSDNVHADLDEIAKLCRLYEDSRRERETVAA